MITKCLIWVLAVLFVCPFTAPGQENKGVSALIVDNANVETEVMGLKSNYDEFGGYDVFGGGFPITIKKFIKSPKGREVEYTLWLFFDQIKTVVVDKRGKIKIGSNNDSSIEGEILGARLSGTLSLGELQISMSDIKSMIIRSAPPTKLDAIKTIERTNLIKVRKGIIELRDGSKIEARDLRRYYFVPSGYINVPTRHYNDALLWIKLKRGEGLLKRSIPFEKIKEMIFLEKGEREVKVTLDDGTLLSGILGGDTHEESFDYITGRSDTRLFTINTYGFNIKSIKFID